MEYFYEMFDGLPRGGPGSDASTRKAFELLSEVPDRPRILDVGCGPGKQTLELARLTKGSIVAVDNSQPHLDALTKDAKEQGLADHIEPVNMSMMEMDLDPGSFDIIWSEGAIFIIGFEKGLKEWRRLLRPGGYLVISEAVYHRPDPPALLEEFWDNEYPAIATAEEDIRIIEDAGYKMVGHFPLPKEDWLEFYSNMERKLASMRLKYQGNDAAQGVLDMFRAEMDMYMEYGDWYGYEFFAMRKP